MKKIIGWILAVGIAIAVAAFSVYLIQSDSRKKLLEFEKVPPAFGAARWGMSEKDVAFLNSTELEPAGTERRFYNPKEDVKDPSRYKVRRQRGASLLGREADVFYVFFDDRLFSYHLFMKDIDPARLYRETADYLSAEFGPDYSPQSDGTSLKRIWHKKNVIVNFWFSQDELSLRNTYQSAFGVVYVPLEQAISD